MSEPPEEPGAKAPVVAAPSEPAGETAGGRRRSHGRSREGGRARKRRPWYWWLANLMILGGILVLPGYFLGTCACTALHQNQLEKELITASPQLASAAETLAADDFLSLATSSSLTPPPSATEDQISEIEAAIAKAKAEREAKLVAFKAAADAFEIAVRGQIGKPIGKIIIPAIGVDVIIVEGTGVRDLKEGPGHWEETPFPGQGGNFVISGHRTTYGAPFFKLNELKPGDEINIVLPYAACKYTVSEVFVVYPHEVDTVAQAGREQISLAACHPIYSAKQRIVAKGELSSFKLIEEPATP